MGTVLVYSIPDESSDAYHTRGVRVLKYDPVSGWVLAFEETTPKMGRHDQITVEKLRAPNGKEGLLVIRLYSGAGTVTDWHVLTAVNGKITNLDSRPERAKILDPRGYVHKGYNGVKSKGDLVVERLPGYSRRRARCCANRPSLEMTFKFTGSAITFDSVKELPYGVPKSGSPGPLLRVGEDDLWAYGYEVDDGFLVLAGSETPLDHAPSTPPEIVALRKSLLEQEVLADLGYGLTLTRNYKFASPSVAAGVMLARPANGQEEWKDENGRPAGARQPTSTEQ